MSEEATEAKTFDAKITKMGDEIAGLTLKEAVDLADYMKDTYGIEPAAGGAVMMAGGGGGDEAGGEAEQTLAMMAAGSPMKRIGEPEEIVAVMLMLLSPANTYMNGQAIAVDGGVSAF